LTMFGNFLFCEFFMKSVKISLDFSGLCWFVCALVP